MSVPQNGPKLPDISKVSSIKVSMWSHALNKHFTTILIKIIFYIIALHTIRIVLFFCQWKFRWFGKLRILWPIYFSLALGRRILWPIYFSLALGRRILWCINFSLTLDRRILWCINFSLTLGRRILWSINFSLTLGRRILWCIYFSLTLGRRILWSIYFFFLFYWFNNSGANKGVLYCTFFKFRTKLSEYIKAALH